jgi:sulfur relay (sulfurtransferase) complex TusBCD TusD component (DsrE family)
MKPDRPDTIGPTPIGTPHPTEVNQKRLFVREPGWHVAIKNGSEKENCYMTAPGQDYYHRLLDGEIHLIHGDEKLCLPCAQRRGLLVEEPRRLQESVMVSSLSSAPPYDLDNTPR